MGIWSWLFPSDDDLLRRARTRMAAGRWEQARKDLVHCKAPEAEALYDECCRHIDKGEAATTKKRLKAEGFHGWRVEAAVKNGKLKAELEGLITEELGKAGVDLDMPEIDEKLFKAAVARAQRRVKNPRGEMGAVRLVPIVEEKLARQMRQMQEK
ncbi:MAG: hypothetical protein QM820_38545 [Minicystis sp.]